VRDPADYPSSRSAGTKSLPCAHYVRFSESENERLHKIVDRLGGTIQRFLRNAANAALDEEEARRGAGRHTAVTATPSPTGYGLRRRFYESTPEEPRPAPPPLPPPPQIVVTTTPPSATVEIDRLAIFVAKGGPEDKREDRLHTAVQILSISAKDDIEKTELAKSLDEKVLTIEGRPPAPSSPLDLVTDWIFGKPLR
jgi:hypothetical protein